MNKTALKNFATNARKELIDKVKARAFRIGITEDSIKKALIESSDAIYIDDKPLDANQKKQREKLISRIKEIGYKQVVEEVAYTWFNRFTALRYMEVNNYLPTKVRVLSSSNSDNPEPDIIKEALTIELDIEKERVYELKVNNKTEELYKYLVIRQCNSLNKYLPFMFETIDDYKEILFPEGLLVKDSFLRQMTDVTVIPESDWEQVEIIGWLYQYYIAEEKDRVFANLKGNIKISKETLPAATQLFTPSWIVKYMVENSLGRIWLESNPDSLLKSEWRYYLEEAEHEEDVLKQLELLRYRNVNPEEITFLDPCCGSGHILVYAFDVFYDIYIEKGYIESEIPKIIIENNLYGLDVDDRAVQLASFAVMMKAREKSRRIFNQDIKLNICAIQESKWMTEVVVDMLIDKTQDQQQQLIQQELVETLKESFWDAKEYGSLIKVDPLNFELLERRLFDLKTEHANLIDMIEKQKIEENLPSILKQAKILSKKYDVVCTNPPYMGSSNMNNNMKKYVQSNFEKSKGDLCTVFIESGMSQTKKNGYCSLVTMHSWFFLGSFESLRKKVLDNFTVTSILHLGMEAFDGIIGKVVQTAAFVLKNNHLSDYIPVGIRLVDFYDGRKYEKETQFFNQDNVYKTVKQKNFSNIPGSPFAYWVSDTIRKIFSDNSSIYSISTSASQNVTGNNNKFVRYFWELNNALIGQGNRWIFYAKGGGFRKWYGNLIDVVDWSFEAREAYRTGHASQIIPEEYWYKKGVTWGLISTLLPSFRVLPEGSTFDKGGSSIFINNKELYNYVIGFLNSKVALELLRCLNITLNFQVKDIRNLPIKIDSLSYVTSLVEETIQISKQDWDSFEISWDFNKHPFLNHKGNSSNIEDTYNIWSNFAKNQFYTLKKNEEEINRVFINIYDLKDEMIPDIDEEDVIVRKADKERDIKTFISYAIGCMFGRYSLDEEGLKYAGGKFDPEIYRTFTTDKDNILPVLSSAYFENDILFRFIEFVKVTFGEENIVKNLQFIADSLGKKDGETAKEAISRYFLNDFFNDHVQTYKRRPIYWLFTSGKQKAFNCLIYMHRYDKSTLSRIRTDYLHEFQIRLDAERKSLLDIIEGDGTAKEISNAKKELKSLELKIEELRAYDEQLHHMADMQIEIDLDHGVASNYAKFEGLLAPIK